MSDVIKKLRKESLTKLQQRLYNNRGDTPEVLELRAAIHAEIERRKAK